jgi:hypothetical protein
LPKNNLRNRKGAVVGKERHKDKQIVNVGSSK